MVDLLKTSMTVIVTVIPPHPDGTPRKGCHLLTCPHAFGQNSSNAGDSNGDYENVHANAGMPSQQTPSGDKTVFESQQQRSLSPPRSSNSSGYGTGSSRKSSTVLTNQLLTNQFNQKGNTMPVNTNLNPKTEILNHNGLSGSTSSGNSGDDERWYDFGDHAHSSSENSPPPLPNRLLGGKGSAFHKVNNTSSVVISGNSMLANVATVNGQNSSSNSATSSPSIYQHPPPPKMVVMPKQLPEMNNKRVVRKYSYPVEDSKREARVTYLTEFELTNQSSANNMKHMKSNGMKPIDPDLEASHRSSRGQRSEDELSAVSTSKSKVFFFSVKSIFHAFLSQI